MKSIVFALAIFAIASLASCKKENSLPVPLTASNVSDMYTETGLPVQVSKTHFVDANIGGYLEALPAHYADHPNKHYPVIIYLHGQGELGNGTLSDLQRVSNNAIPKLISEGMFPSNFTVNDTTFQFIVLSPQFKAWPQPADINAMLDYAEQKYRVKISREYICGLSMGGGGTWDYAWNLGKRITAIVPIAGASWPTTEKGKDIAGDNIATWAFHNDNDPTVPSWYSVDYVKDINSYNPPTHARLTLFQASGHDAWSKATNPNYTENGMNIYEWMLKHRK